MGAGRYELLVGHHHFDSQRQCVELWLSRAVLATAGSSLELTEPFRTVFITNPCITFNGAENTNTFEGHFSGGRIARLKGDEILFSTGDHGWVGLDGHPALSQDDSSTLGKILLVNTSTNKVSIYAKGVRNPQGLTVDSQGRIWETEHGPRGGDELNLIVEGGNYGWPDSTYGTDYGPLPWPLNVEQGRHQMGIAPQFAWSPSIAPSNLVESKGAEFPLWRGDLLVASLGGSAIHRLHLEGTRVAYDEPIPFEGVRIRDIIEMPGGSLALLTDDRTVILVRNADAKNNSPFLDVARQKQRTRDMSNEERAKAVAGRYAKSAIAAVQDESPMFEPAVRGANVFQRNCAVCHSISSLAAGTGPSLKGVVGRRVGSTTFAYSHVLTGHSDIWTSRRIVDFAVKTQHMYPGTVMSPVQLSGTDQADLATYLDVAGR
jgi:cytochrome c2